MKKESKKKKKSVQLRHLKPEEQLKYEIAEELGLLDRILSNGWESLTASESGRIGGLVRNRKEQMNRQSDISRQNERMTKDTIKKKE